MISNNQWHNIPNSPTSAQIYIPKDPNPPKVDIDALVKQAKELVTIIEDKEEAKRMEEKEKKQKESANAFWLESENFKVDSTNWENEKNNDWKELLVNWNPIKVNPEKDVWEIVMGDWTKEQLFTWDAAMRETEKVWEKIPTIEEWWKIIQSINPNISLNWWWQIDTSVRETLNLKFTGCRGLISGRSSMGGGYAYYWSSSPCLTSIHGLCFNLSYICPSTDDNRANGFSIRCFKN